MPPRITPAGIPDRFEGGPGTAAVAVGSGTEGTSGGTAFDFPDLPEAGGRGIGAVGGGTAIFPVASSERCALAPSATGVIMSTVASPGTETTGVCIKIVDSAAGEGATTGTGVTAAGFTGVTGAFKRTVASAGAVTGAGATAGVALSRTVAGSDAGPGRAGGRSTGAFIMTVAGVSSATGTGAGAPGFTAMVTGEGSSTRAAIAWGWLCGAGAEVGRTVVASPS